MIHLKHMTHGIGQSEPFIAPATPALTDAIFAAIGRRIRELALRRAGIKT